jgi:valyl-tRNA synthetase
MDKAYDPKAVEERIYRMWEEAGYFTPKIDPKKKPFTILLPPPNANADLHLGHAMYVVEDILIRYHRMQGDPTLWLPGADHAGFETQYVYEKELAKQGKSRFDFDRETLYQNIWDFVHANRGKMENQLRRLGFSLDWSRNIFTLDPAIIKTVYQTFKTLFDDRLVYRSDRLVNYCTRDGTAFADLEVVNKETEGLLYFIKFPLVGGGDVTIATTRPETIVGDVAVMVNPKDKRYKDVVGKHAILPVANREVPIIADGYVDMKFGTGAVKVTPAHDHNDYEIAKKHGLTFPPIIGFDGRMKNTEVFDGMKVKVAREEMLAKLTELGLLVKTESHQMVVKTCYKCGNVLEPLPMEQWYVKVAPLTQKAIAAIKSKKIGFIPKRFEKIANTWLSDFHDWNISRQIVWGMRIPAWQCADCKTWTVSDGAAPQTCTKCASTNLTQDPDTFDTWFSSGQWPFATLRATQEGDFDYFYPTSVMETGYDILPWWVCRMMMLGLYETGDVPFRIVYLHGLVRDKQGQKMSKSKGNVINPLKMVDAYGADALRMALVFGTGAGNDQSLSEDKIRGMRNFANKMWNAARFVSMLQEEKSTDSNKVFKKELKDIVKRTTGYMEKMNLNAAAELLYEKFWHWYCDWAIEQAKTGTINKSELEEGLHIFMKLLHPFMPFVTEEIWGKMPGKKTDPLIISSWPT